MKGAALRSPASSSCPLLVGPQRREVHLGVVQLGRGLHGGDGGERHPRVAHRVAHQQGDLFPELLVDPVGTLEAGHWH
jgi:hypothetical protein